MQKTKRKNDGQYQRCHYSLFLTYILNDWYATKGYTCAIKRNDTVTCAPCVRRSDGSLQKVFSSLWTKFPSTIKLIVDMKYS